MGLETKVNALASATTTALNTAKGELEAKDTYLDGKIDALNSTKADQTALDAEKQALETKVNALASVTTTALNTAKGELKAKDTYLDGKIDALNSTKADQTALDAEKQALETKVNALA